MIDIEEFNYEIREEVKDATFLEGLRNTVHESLKHINLNCQ